MSVVDFGPIGGEGYAHNGVAGVRSPQHVRLIDNRDGSSASVISLETFDLVLPVRINITASLSGAADDLHFGIVSAETPPTTRLGEGVWMTPTFYGVTLDLWRNQIRGTSAGERGQAVGYNPRDVRGPSDWALRLSLTPEGGLRQEVFRDGQNVATLQSNRVPDFTNARLALGAWTGGSAGTFDVLDIPVIGEGILLSAGTEESAPMLLGATGGVFGEIARDAPWAYYRFVDPDTTEVKDALGERGPMTLTSLVSPTSALAPGLSPAALFTGQHGVLPSGLTGGDLTYEVWWRPTGLYQLNDLLGVDSEQRLIRSGDSGIHPGRLQVNLGGTTHTAPFSTNTTGVPQHLAFRYRAATGETTIFVNGVPAWTTTQPAQRFTGNAVQFLYNGVYASRQARGAFSDVAFFRAALPDDRIAAHYMAGLTGRGDRVTKVGITPPNEAWEPLQDGLITVAVPPNVRLGDLMVVHLAWDVAPDKFELGSPGGGWDSPFLDSRVPFLTSSGEQMTHYSRVYVKYVDETEPPTYSWRVGTGNRGAGAMVVYRNANLTGRGATSASGDTDTPGQITAPTMARDNEDGLLVQFASSPYVATSTNVPAAPWEFDGAFPLWGTATDRVGSANTRRLYAGETAAYSQASQDLNFAEALNTPEGWTFAGEPVTHTTSLPGGVLGAGLVFPTTSGDSWGGWGGKSDPAMLVRFRPYRFSMAIYVAGTDVQFNGSLRLFPKGRPEGSGWQPLRDFKVTATGSWVQVEHEFFLNHGERYVGFALDFSLVSENAATIYIKDFEVVTTDDKLTVDPPAVRHRIGPDSPSGPHGLTLISVYLTPQSTEPTPTPVETDVEFDATLPALRGHFNGEALPPEQQPVADLTWATELPGISGAFEVVATERPILPDDRYARRVLADDPFLYYRMSAVPDQNLGSAGPEAMLQPQPRGASVPVVVEGLVPGPDSAALSYNPPAGSQYRGGETLSSSAYSIELWVQGRGGGMPQMIASRYNAHDGSSASWKLRFEGDSIICLYHYVPELQALQVTVTPFSTNHVVATWAPGQGARLYLNGELAAGNAAMAFRGQVASSFFLGNEDENAYRMNGVLDEVAFYKHALTAEQVRAHYAAATESEPGPEPPVDLEVVGELPGISGVFEVEAGDTPTSDEREVRLDGVLPGITGSFTVESEAVPLAPVEVRLAGRLPRPTAKVRIERVQRSLEDGEILWEVRLPTLRSTLAIELPQPPAPVPMIMALREYGFDRAPGVLVVSVLAAIPFTAVEFSIGEVVLNTVLTDGSGSITGVSLTTPALPAGEHTLNARSQNQSEVRVASINFWVDRDPIPLPETPAPDLPPVKVPQATRRWVFQDPMPGGLGSWVLPRNPVSGTHPLVSRSFSPRRTTAPRGQHHVFEGSAPTHDWTFTGFLFTQEEHELLEAYAALNRRIYVIDDLDRAWAVALTRVEVTPRLRTRFRLPGEEDQVSDWVAEYSVTATTYRDWWVPQ